MNVHPAASAFPLMDGEQFDALVDDIRRNGLRIPPVFDGDVLLDGRNRIRACQKLGRNYKRDQWDKSGSQVSFIVSVNLVRRHLSTSQRAMIAADLLPQFRAEAKERMRDGGRRSGGTRRGVDIDPPSQVARKARHDAAKALGVGATYVSHAARLQAERPELAAEVRAGAKGLNAAAIEAGHRPRSVPGQRNGTPRSFPRRRTTEAAVRSAIEMLETIPEALRALGLTGIEAESRASLIRGLRHTRRELTRLLRELANEE